MTGTFHSGKATVSIPRSCDCPETRFGFWANVGFMTLARTDCSTVFNLQLTAPSWAEEMTQWVKSVLSKLEDLTLSPNIHVKC